MAETEPRTPPPAGTVAAVGTDSSIYAEPRQNGDSPEGLLATLTERGTMAVFAFRKDKGLQHIRQSIEVLDRKATPSEVEQYRQFIVNLAHKVAAAHREHGQDVSEPEKVAIDDIVAALTTATG